MRTHTNNLTDVLRLAHFYQVEEMLRRCGQELLKSLSKETVVDTVVAVRAVGGGGGTMAAVRAIWDELLKCLGRDKSLLATVVESFPDFMGW